MRYGGEMGFQLGAQLIKPCSKIRLPSAGPPWQLQPALGLAGLQGTQPWFFGCRRPEEDHLYWEEMLEMARPGVLHEVYTAIPACPDQPKVNATTACVERVEH